MTDDALAALGLGRPAEAARAGPPLIYAYLVQVSGDGTRWGADWTEPSGGFEHDAPDATEVACRVLRRRFLQVRADGDQHRHRMWFRVDVWTLTTATVGDHANGNGAHANGGSSGQGGPPVRADDLETIALSGRHLQSRGVPPDTVEIRTPAQVRHEIDG
ncbi:conserved hypothetical protein [Frankia sp. AiPs1]|uniref:hypothetical protein n=1 Tax=Frankia sp. AiPa1 TaxID=573492 RepID=UPI00202B44F2|nr:hypothetical protein [Frankia sp. AiPa1]MCL9759706.1 hypothetical protein [Frankia sp. AiPa1]